MQGWWSADYITLDACMRAGRGWDWHKSYAKLRRREDKNRSNPLFVFWSFSCVCVFSVFFLWYFYVWGFFPLRIRGSMHGLLGNPKCQFQTNTNPVNSHPQTHACTHARKHAVKRNPPHLSRDGTSPWT